MKKIKLTLKWRFTLLTVLIMTTASGILAIAINYDLNRQVPHLAESLKLEAETYVQEYYFGASEIYPTETAPWDVNDDIFENEIAIEMPINQVIGETVSNVYTTSIIAFFIIIILGGVTTYLAVNKALSPVTQLNDNIKKISENNLSSNLDVEGPHDEIKELTISFNKMIAKLDNAFASQKRFNSSIAHELKTPLAVIKTNIDVLKNKKSKGIDEYEETLLIVEKSIFRMDAIIETLLDIIKQENAPLNEEISIDEIIEDVAEDLSIIAMKKGIDIDLNISEIKNKIMGNEILLYRAFYNVVENAIKYNHSNGKIKIYCEQMEDIIKVSIEDTGKGIHQKHFDDIFKPFFRCEGVNIYTNNGIGLGLSLTKSAIELHGGYVKIESELDKGSKFTFVFTMKI